MSQASEERYSLLVNSVKDYAIFMLDPEGNVETWNTGAERIKGYRKAEVVGRHISLFYLPEEREARRPQWLLSRAARDGVVEDEGWRVRKDGTRFWADVVITALRDEEGTLVGFGKVTRDLSVRRAAEEALRQSEERFRLMVGSVKDYAIFMLDEEGRVQSWNEGAQLAKGYKAAEIIGNHISTFYPQEAVAAGKPQALLAAAVKDGRAEEEGWRVRKDGTRFWADVVITALFDGAGKLCGFTKVTRDLTAKRRAEEALRESEGRFRVLVQSVKDYAIFMLDLEGRVVSWNAGAARINGYTAEEIIGQHFSIFRLPEDVAAGKPEQERELAIANGKFEEEGWRLRKDGTTFWANVVLEPLRDTDGKLIGFAKVTRDLTERRASDAERLRLAQAQEAVRLRDEFLSIASHELKTPLTAVQIQLQNLIRMAPPAEERLKHKAERALAAGERLSNLVDTLLDVSRIATGKLELAFSSFDLGRAAREVLERLEEHATREGCSLSVHSDGPVVGEWDRTRVEQILMNLVSNAIKYGAGTSVDVRVGLQGDSAVLSVADQGPGIPEADRDRIFGRFERAVSMRHYGGLGLGLYVARQIAETHGGSIAVEAVEPHGARFVVHLPISRPSASASNPEREAV